MTDENPAPGSANEVSLGGETPKAKTNLFIGPNGLRAGWRLLVYVLIVAAFSAVITIVVRKFVGPLRGTPGVWAQLLQEVVGFAVVFGAAAIMSKIERRRLGDYGLPASEIFGRKFWLGFLLGLVEVSLLIGLIGAFGGYSFGPLALQGGADAGPLLSLHELFGELGESPVFVAAVTQALASLYGQGARAALEHIVQ